MRRNASAMALLLTCLPVAASAQQAVEWQRPVNVAVRGAVIEKTRGCDGCDDAGALSRQAISSGDGYVEFTVIDDYHFLLAGLTQEASTRFHDLDYAFRFNSGGWVDIMENGVYQAGADTTFAPGDLFRIAVRNGRVQYLKNGRVLSESRQAPRYPLMFAASLGNIGAGIRNARILASDARTTDRDEASVGRFAALDRNRDRYIARNEWPGTRREFNQMDTNRDGRLTRQEYRAQRADGPGAGTAGQMIRVDPRQRWTDTGIWVDAGDIVTIEAEGTVQMSGNPDDKATPAGSFLRRTAQNAPVPNAQAGTLIAQIGSTEPQVIGARASTRRAPVGGVLRLGVNDDRLGDNSGEYRAIVTVQRR